MPEAYIISIHTIHASVICADTIGSAVHIWRTGDHIELNPIFMAVVICITTIGMKCGTYVEN